MKGTAFNKPLEWNIETLGESWHQGDSLKGTVRVKNHGAETVSLQDSGVGLSFAEIKKVQSRAEGALKTDSVQHFPVQEIVAGGEASMEFSFAFSSNGPVTDKKSSYYLCYGKNFNESQLQLKVVPKDLYLKIVGLLDTFHRFKLKDYKTSKKGVEFKLTPPTARDMANIEGLLLTFSMQEESLSMKFDFQVKRLDTSSVTTKINKETVTLEKVLSPKEYSLGRDMLNQDQLLKNIEQVLSEVKMKAVF
ncbi:MAG: hypothetical protein ACLGHN_02570 [Bacteriovoracia bacterium]